MMRNRNFTHARKLRQFQALSKKVNRALQAGEFQRLPAEAREKAMNRLRLLFSELRRRFGMRRLQRILAGAALLLGFQQASAQVSFTGPTTNPFGYTPVSSYYVQPEAVDIDGDGDLDIFQGDDYGFYTYYENTGTATAPAFAAGQATGFGIDSVAGYYAFLAFADMDGDGDQDVFVGEYDAGLLYYPNVGTATAPAFGTPVSNPFGITSMADRHIPELVDLDGDGDMDLMVSGYSNAWYYYENTGTSAAPAFAAEVSNPFGMTAPSYYTLSAFADLDVDGDMDVIYATYNNQFMYMENTGTATAPAFAAAQMNPFGFTQSLGFPQPVLADMDGDGDADFFHSENTCNIQYYENAPAVSVDDQLTAADLTLAPNPAQDHTLLVLENGNLADEVRVEIYAVDGKLVSQNLVSTKQGNLRERLSLQGLAPGMYTLRVTSGTQTLTTRLTKQ